MCVQLPRQTRWSSSLHGRGGRPRVHRQLDHLDYQLQCHDHGGGAYSICADHFFTNISCSSTTLPMAPTTLITRCPHSCYKGRQIDNVNLLRDVDTCSNHLSCHNNDHCKERRYDNRDHRHDNTSKSPRARQFCRHRTDFHLKISALLIFYLFLA